MKHRVTAVPADREPGYVVEDFDTVGLVHLQILSGPSYSEVALASLLAYSSIEGSIFAFGCSRCQVVSMIQAFCERVGASARKVLHFVPNFS